MNTLNYQVIHDLGKPLVFVGQSYHNTCLGRYFAGSRSVQVLSLEDLAQQSNQWFRDHQFMCAMSNIAFKQKIKNFLESKSADLFSVVSVNSTIGHNVTIGRSTLINHMNVLYDQSRIGDFSCVTNFVVISHEVSVGDLCHIGPYCYLCYSEIGTGNFVGLHSQFFGYPETRISTAAWCNFYANSRIANPVSTSGTWAGKKLADTRTSLELAL